MTDHELLEALYDATRASIGLILICEDPSRLRQKLYTIRKQDPALAALTFSVSPTNPTSELWIIKNGKLE